jgi:hypothetical protein
MNQNIFFKLILSIFFAFSTSFLYCQSSYYQKKIKNFAADGMLNYPDGTLLIYGADTINNRDLNVIQISPDTGSINWTIKLTAPPTPSSCQSYNRVKLITSRRTFIGSQEFSCTSMGGILTCTSQIFEFDSTGNILWNFSSDDIFKLINVFENNDSTYTFFANLDDQNNAGMMVCGKISTNGNVTMMNTVSNIYGLEDIIKTSSGEYIGITKGPKIFKLDSLLQTVFVLEIAFQEFWSYNFRVLELVDKSLLIYKQDNSTGHSFIFRLSEQGNFLNGMKITNVLNRMQLTNSDSTIYFSYSTDNYITGILKTNLELQIQSNNSILDSSLHQINVGSILKDGSFFSLYYGYELVPLQTWLLKTDSNITSTCYFDSANLITDTLNVMINSLTGVSMSFGGVINSGSGLQIQFASTYTWEDSCNLRNNGIDDISNDNFTFSPNPFQTSVSIKTENTLMGKLIVINNMGEIVSNENYFSNSSINLERLN